MVVCSGDFMCIHSPRAFRTSTKDFHTYNESNDAQDERNNKKDPVKIQKEERNDRTVALLVYL